MHQVRDRHSLCNAPYRELLQSCLLILAKRSAVMFRRLIVSQLERSEHQVGGLVNRVIGAMPVDQAGLIE